MRMSGSALPAVLMDGEDALDASGGAAKGLLDGVTENVTNAGRRYVVNTVISDLSTVPVGKPDAGAVTLKRIQVSVTPAGAQTAFETVTVATQRSTQVTGSY